jgi:hypothetical protein
MVVGMRGVGSPHDIFFYIFYINFMHYTEDRKTENLMLSIFINRFILI